MTLEEKRKNFLIYTVYHDPETGKATFSLYVEVRPPFGRTPVDKVDLTKKEALHLAKQLLNFALEE